MPYEDYNTVIKYIAKAHLYWLAQTRVSSHTGDIPHTKITESTYLLIDDKYECVNHMNLVNSINYIWNKFNFFTLLPGSI